MTPPPHAAVKQCGERHFQTWRCTQRP